MNRLYAKALFCLLLFAVSGISAASLLAQAALADTGAGEQHLDNNMLNSLRQIVEALERSGQDEQAFDYLMPYRGDVRVLTLLQVLYQKHGKDLEFLPLAAQAYSSQPQGHAELALYLLALQRVGLNDSLRSVAGRFLEQSGLSADNFQFLGYQYRALGLNDEALELFEKARKQLGDRSLFRPEVAALLIDHEQYERALKELFSYFPSQPGEFQNVQHQLYRILESGKEGGRLVCAALDEELRRADGDYRQALLRLLIDVQLTRGERRKAFDMLARLAITSEKNVALNQISVFLGRALKVEAYEEALAAYDLADSLKLIGRDKVLLGKASLYSRMERYRDAETSLRELVALQPPSPFQAEAMNRLGELCLNRLGKPGEALQWYRRNEARDPGKAAEHAPIKISIIQSFIHLDSLDQAEALCSDILGADGADPGLRAEASRLLADIRFFSGQPDSAAEGYLAYAKTRLGDPEVNDAIERAYLIQNDPSPDRSISVIVGRALKSAAAGRIPESTALFQKALAGVDADSAFRVRVSYEMGKMFERASDFPLAAAAYQGILERAPGHYLAPAVELRLSVILLDRLGDREGARRHLENIVFKRAEGVVTPEARRLLRTLEDTKL